MIAIVDYKAGNLTSVAARPRVTSAIDAKSPIAPIVSAPPTASSSPASVPPAPRWKTCIALGLTGVLRDDVARAGKPFLGICIGIQVLFDRSAEDDRECLGIIPGEVVRFPSLRRWAARSRCRRSDGIGCARRARIRSSTACPDNTHFYFVNSYYPVPADPTVTIATSDHGVTVHRRDRPRQRDRDPVPSRKERRRGPADARQFLPAESLTCSPNASSHASTCVPAKSPRASSFSKTLTSAIRSRWRATTTSRAPTKSSSTTSPPPTSSAAS